MTSCSFDDMSIKHGLSNNPDRPHVLLRLFRLSLVLPLKKEEILNRNGISNELGQWLT